MGSPSGLAAVAVAVLVVSLLVAHGACFPDVLPGPNIPTEYTSPYVPPGPNISARYTGEWLDAKATWYGKPTGAGPDDNGGACGFKEVNLPPFNSLSSCGNLPLFKDGKGCGSCFEVKCEKPEACSGQPVTVVITDMNYDPLAPYHFDLSRMGFGAMAKPGREDELRHAGMIDMQFRRVKCRYQGLTVTFHVEEGSNPFYFAVLVQYVASDGNVVQVDLKEKANGQWQTLWESWGAIWRLDADHPLEGPFSLRITSESGKQLVAKDVIPKDWKPKTVYPSKVQLD